MLHYENVSGKCSVEFFHVFIICAQIIDCGYTLEPPRRVDGSNEYSQSMFWSNNKKNRYTRGVQWGIHYTDMFADVGTPCNTCVV